jgi:hypothetical protein
MHGRLCYTPWTKKGESSRTTHTCLHRARKEVLTNWHPFIWYITSCAIFVPGILIAGLTKYILADLAYHHSLGRKAHLVVPWTCGPSIEYSGPFSCLKRFGCVFNREKIQGKTKRTTASISSNEVCRFCVACTHI